MSLQLASLLGDRYQQSVSKLLLVGQRMWYHRGRQSQRLYGVAWHCLHTTSDTKCLLTLLSVRGTLSSVSKALTRMVRTPDRQRILVLPGKVTIHQLICYFISLHSGALRWVTGKGDRR
jgi:hypothetical protein